MKEAIEYLKYKEIVKNKEINAYLESVSGIPLLPTTVLTDRFKGSGFNLLNYKVVPLLEYYYS